MRWVSGALAEGRFKRLQLRRGPLNADSSAYESIKHLYRPGHADYSYAAKYGLRDWRGSGRASGVERLDEGLRAAQAQRLALEAELGRAVDHELVHLLERAGV